MKFYSVYVACISFRLAYIIFQSSCLGWTGFVPVMENLESHGILYFHFPVVESPEI